MDELTPIVVNLNAPRKEKLNESYLSMFGGICWEIVEFSLGYFKPDWFYNNWCNGVTSSNEWWYYQYSDIFANLIGFLIGMNLSKIM